MKEITNKNIIFFALAISVVLNIFLFFSSSSSLEKNAFCAEFKEQSANRIRTYYSDGSLENIYPDEIFYSKKRKGCVAVWSGAHNNLANNGYHINKVIFDPITNEEIFSDIEFYFTDKTSNNYEANTKVIIEFGKTLKELR